jgi:hypothetical protein
VKRSPIIAEQRVRPRILEVLLVDLPRDIAYYITSEGREGGERLMPFAAAAIVALGLFIVGAQLVLRFGGLH